MARISQPNHKNTWGIGNGLEPQRHDLWLVDFKVAVEGIRAAYRLLSGEDGTFTPKSELPQILPQYVQSISLPENRVRAEDIKRCSIPYRSPSWDDPLDVLKVQFLLVQKHNRSRFAPYEGDDEESAVLIFLNQWLQLVRTGRGLRTYGGPDDNSAEGPLLLEVPGSPGSLLIPSHRFSFHLVLVRGVTDPDQKALSRSKLLRIQYDTAAAERKAARQAADKAKQGPTAGPLAPPPTSDAPKEEAISGTFGALDVATRILVKDAWLSGFKLSDLTYTGSDSVLVDATFYAESIMFGRSPL